MLILPEGQRVFENRGGDSEEALRLLSLGPLSLSWWLRLRWMGTVVLAFLFPVADFVLHIPLPWGPVSLVWALLFLSNMAIHRWMKAHSILSLRRLGSVLAFDTVLLTILLYWTGGPTNPFSVFYLVQITLAAVVLNSRWTWGIVFFSIVCFGLLFWDSMPLNGSYEHGQAGGGFSLHLQGMWVAFSMAAGLIALLVGRVSGELRVRNRELLRAKDLAARTERLTALTTLAAGAAHELGTPLGTIAMVAGEIERASKRGGLKQEVLLSDIRLLRSQVARCRTILEQMGEKSGESISEAPLDVHMDEVLELIKERLPLGAWERIEVHKDPELTVLYVPPRATAQVVAGLIRNGLDASEEGGRIVLGVHISEDGVSFIVRDWGCGMDETMLERACDPFFSTKAPQRGMGLGLFLSRLFAQRLGGSLEIRSVLDEGTIVTLRLPRKEAMGGGAYEQNSD